MHLNKMNSFDTPEFRLLASCLCDRVDESALVNIDWTRFCQLLERHRIGPMVRYSLDDFRESIPKPVWTHILSVYQLNTFRTLQQLELTNRIDALLKSANIQWMLIKGQSLAYLYRNPADRFAQDIDLLLPDHDSLWTAADLLLREGFEPLYFDPRTSTRQQRRRYLRLSKDLVLREAASGTVIELHARLLSRDGDLPLDTDTVWDARLLERAGHHARYVMSKEQQVTYLFVHGSLCGWFRLKWLADIVLLCQQHDHGDIMSWLDKARQENWQRALLIGLGVTHALMQTDLPPAILDAIRKDPPIDSLVEHCILMIHMETPMERQSMPLPYYIKQGVSRAYFRCRVRPEWSHVSYEIESRFSKPIGWKGADPQGQSGARFKLGALKRWCGRFWESGL